MSSISSTVILKKPDAILQRRKSSMFGFCISASFWLCCGLLNAVLSDISPNIQGVSVSLRAEETILSLLSTAFLLYGLKKENYNWSIFWILLTIWYMYDMQYYYVKNMFKTLHITEDVPLSAWVAFILHGFGLVLKLLLVFRIAGLVLKQWNRQKIEKDFRNANFALNTNFQK